jgi:PAS domain S-box-containing protein
MIEPLPLFINLPALEQVMDCAPMMVPPETLLIDLFSCMGHPDPPQKPEVHDKTSASPVPSEQVLKTGVLVTEGSRLIGIVTTQDILKCNALGMDLANTQVAEVMTTPVITLTLSPPQDILVAWSIMRQRHIRHLPLISQQGQVVGLIHQNDLFQWFDPVMLLQEMRDRQQAEIALRESEENFRILATHAPVGIFQTDAQGDCVFVNHKWLELTGLSFAQAMGQGWVNALYAGDRERVFAEWYEAAQDNREFFLEYRFQTPQGKINWVVGNAVAIHNDAGIVNGYFGTVTNINAAKQAETIQQQADIELRRSEQKFRAIFDSMFQFIGLLTPEGIVTEANQTALAVVAAERADVIGKPFWETPWWNHSPPLQAQLKQAIARAAQGELVRFEAEHLLANGDLAIVDFSLKPAYDETGAVVMLIPEGREITQNKRIEVALRDSEQRLQAILDNSTAIIFMKDTQGRYLMINHRYEVLFHLDRDEIKGKTDHDIFPKAIADAFQANDREVMAAGTALEKEEVAPLEDGLHTYISLKFPLFDPEGNVYAVCGMSTDISDRKAAEVELQRQQEELARSNADLQQFAYVASHDLQEPLRMIISYLELLERRYGGQLDARADQFIGFAVDGAARMQALINDLLNYSRVGTREQPFVPVDCEQVLHNVLRNLQVAIADSQAVITHSPLPQVQADVTQITQLFQNLIGNAIKFRSEDPPQIQIEVEQTDEHWLFSVRDNGIGIEEQYLDRIFVIFKRLHSRIDYPGTGMGLAICKKIVERHGGNLWVESVPSEGSTFYFTLPKSNPI